MSPQRRLGKVLVLGTSTGSLLAVARSLGRGGIDVHLAAHQLDRVALHSRYISRAYELAGSPTDRTAWKSALIALMKREGYDLIIPGNDWWVTAVQQCRRELEPLGRLYVLSDAAFVIFFNKLKTSELARSLGIPVPREATITRPEDASNCLSTFRMPVILKPSMSYNAADPTANHQARKAYTPQEFSTQMSDMLRLGPIAVQEFFVGEGVGVELLLHEGEPLLAFQHDRLHEPLHGGGSSYRKSVAVSPQLLNAALALLSAVRYTGLAMVEFRVNRQTGTWVLLEVNARLWGSLPLAVAAGADFPLALYQLLVEGRSRVQQRYREELYCRNLTWDLSWQLQNLRANRSDDTLNIRPRLKDLLDTLAHIIAVREHMDSFTLDDPWPLLAELAQIGRACAAYAHAGAGRLLSGRLSQLEV